MTNEQNTQRMPLLALRGLTVFPRMLIHFDVGREKSIRALEEALTSEQTIFLVAQRETSVDDPETKDLHVVGTVSRVCQILRLPGDNMRVLVEGLSRAHLIQIVRSSPVPIADVSPLDLQPKRYSARRAEAATRLVRELFENYVNLSPRLGPDVILRVSEVDEPGYLADFVAQNMAVSLEDRQTVLETLPAMERLEKVIGLLLHETEILEIEQMIQGKLHRQLGKSQREYVLREKIKAIQSELGEQEDIAGEFEEYEKKISASNLPPESDEKLRTELGRLSHMMPLSPEAAVVRTWLDSVLALPWGRATRDSLDIARAARQLDRDHYGLGKVKDRVLEFMAVKALTPSLKEQVLCLIGPPGVGKTSVAQSVARAMGRKMARVSLGGARDEADIRGHRKTYIGAMPGRIMAALRQAGTCNPVLILDEVDKMGHDFRGDPAAALLEVFDPEQNNAFRDHYMEIPFDLSDTLFIATANTTETIPRALLDRVEVIELGSYTDEEKLQIARRHLVPKQLKRHGLQKDRMRFSDNALRLLIAGYTRESGVRNLEREIATCCRKAAKRLATEEVTRVSVKPGDLEGLLGVRKFKPDQLRGKAEVGVASGLAWTQTGGELLEVEAGAVEGSGKVDLTGNLGDVMKESARAALTYIRSRCGTLGVDPEFHLNRDIHVHFPEGATPKDGPSAGITAAVAMVSALTGTPVRRDVAMTGEITLRGRVLPVGGLREKTMAALRAGVKTVIIPRENEKDLADLDPAVRDALRFIPVENMDAVLKAALDPVLCSCAQGECKPPPRVPIAGRLQGDGGIGLPIGGAS